jgi:hypothetical protein
LTIRESMYGAVKNGSALALHIGLLRICTVPTAIVKSNTAFGG